MDGKGTRRSRLKGQVVASEVADSAADIPRAAGKRLVRALRAAYPPNDVMANLSHEEGRVRIARDGGRKDVIDLLAKLFGGDE